MTDPTKNALDALTEIEKILVSQVGGTSWPEIFAAIRKAIQPQKPAPEEDASLALDQFKTIRSCCETYLSEETARSLQSNLDRVEDVLIRAAQHHQKPAPNDVAEAAAYFEEDNESELYSDGTCIGVGAMQRIQTLIRAAESAGQVEVVTVEEIQKIVDENTSLYWAVFLARRFPHGLKIIADKGETK